MKNAEERAEEAAISFEDVPFATESTRALKLFVRG
jgi:hypothetical protein